MKRYGYLFEEITSFKNLLLAAKKAFRRKKDRIKVAGFYFQLEPELLKLQEELIRGTYELCPYRTFKIFEPKERNICAANFRDRVVHHAICNVIEPVFEKSFIYDTYACRKEKGTHKAIKRVKDFAGKNNYFLKSDIRKFFESVDHEVLKKLLREKFKDEKLLSLLDRIIEHPITDITTGKGLPIGNLTSQYFSNFYLNKLDHFIKEKLRIKSYVRYMDDFTVFSGEKPVLHEILFSITEFLKEHLLLSIKDKATIIAPVNEGIPYLGFRIFPSMIRLDRKKWSRFKHKIRKKEFDYINGNINQKSLVQSVSSMIAHVSHASTVKLRRDFFAQSILG